MPLPSIFVSDPQGLSIGLSDDTRPCEVYDHVPAYHGLSDSVTPKDSVSERGSYSMRAKRLSRTASSPLDKSKHGRMTMFEQGKPPKSLNSPWRTSKPYLGGTLDMNAIMDQQPIPTIKAPEIMSNPHTPLILPPLENSAHSSGKDKVKLMAYQECDTTSELYKAKVSKKRENLDDDASHCSGSLVDSSEEEDNSDYECDNIIIWNYSQHDALPSYLPYTRDYDENTSSPCSDSPESGSTTSGTTSDTTASSSASGLAGGNGLRGNEYTPPSAGTGFPNNGKNPVLRTKEGFGTRVTDPQPLPLICWYPAAGIACNAKHVSSSSKTRYLWR